MNGATIDLFRLEYIEGSVECRFNTLTGIEAVFIRYLKDYLLFSTICMDLISTDKYVYAHCTGCLKKGRFLFEVQNEKFNKTLHKIHKIIPTP